MVKIKEKLIKLNKITLFDSKLSIKQQTPQPKGSGVFYCDIGYLIHSPTLQR